MQRLHKCCKKFLEDAWTLDADDKDMIVMQHLFGYELHGVKKQIESSFVVKGGKSNLHRHG